MKTITRKHIGQQITFQPFNENTGKIYDGIILDVKRGIVKIDYLISTFNGKPVYDYCIAYINIKENKNRIELR